MTPITHRLSACHRHPTVPISGVCATCLRERLAGFLSPPSPDHRHTTSDAASEPRRRSCEIQARRTLSDLIREKRGRSRKPEAESENSDFQIGEPDGNEEAVRVRDEVDEETKTMKEFIDLELQARKQIAMTDLRNFRGAANAFADKLEKLKWKHKLKKNRNRNRNSNGNRNGNGNGTVGMIGEYGLRRRSCDLDPRFSNDTVRASVERPRFSLDGCLIGKACSCSYSCQSPCSVVDGSKSHESHGRESIEEVADELKPISNAKVSPAATTELFHDGSKEFSLRESNNVKSSSGELWMKLRRRVVNVRSSESVCQRLIRSYSLNRRKPCSGMGGLVNGLGDSETKGNVLNGRKEFMLQRNRSVGL